MRVLSRSVGKNRIYWNPDTQEVDRESLKDAEVVINLCGAGIADKSWTSKRKKELLDSRVDPINFLFSLREHMPNLKQFISASGITCYGYDPNGEPYNEHAPYGSDYLSQLVEQWEQATEQFESYVPTLKMRISVVISQQGGAVEKMAKPMRYGFGAAVGTGKQIVPWIHIDDLCRFVLHGMSKQLSGTFNCNAGNATNKELTLAIAEALHKKVWMPNVPAFMMRLMFGEMASMLLKGVKVSNEALKSTGFEFNYPTLASALDGLK